MKLIEFKNMMSELSIHGITYYEECDYQVTYKQSNIKIKYQFYSHQISLECEIEKLIQYTDGTLGVTQSYDFVFLTNDLTYDDILNGIDSMKKIVEHNKIKIDILELKQ